MRVNKILFYLSNRGFDQATIEYLDRVVATGKVLMGAADQVILNQFIESWKRGGAGWSQTTQDLWADAYGIWWAGNDSPDAWKINIISPLLFEATEQGGALNKNNDGVAGTGANAANTNLIPSLVMLANDVAAFGYCSSISGGMWGTENASANRFKNLTTEFSTISTRSTHTSNTEEGMWMTNHDFAQQYKWLKAVLRYNGVRSVGSLPTVSMYFSGNNLNGTLQSRTTRTYIFGLMKASIGSEMAIYSCVDELKNGVWPFTRTYENDSTPVVIGSNDYFAFPDLMIGRYSSNLNKVYRTYKRGQDHNVTFPAQLILQTSPDASLNWGSEQVVVTSEHAKIITVTGTGGTCNYVVNGVSYLCTFNTNLTQTAADWVTAHSAALALLNITASSSGAVITLTMADTTATLTATTTLLTGNLNGTTNYSIEVVDNALGEGLTGTVLYFYSTNEVLNSWRRNLYVKRSTDGGVTFGNRIEITQDFNPTGQIAGPGGSITLANGDILKPVYATASGSGTRICYVYRSQDDGLTWSQLSTLSADGSADFEEPTLRLLPNGNILALLRSDPLSGTYYTVSTDSGATWAATSFHSPSTGKNSIAVNSDGLIITIGRWPGNSETNMSITFISFAYQTDLTNWRWRFVDDVANWYMYSGADWSTVNGFIATFSRETNDDFSSPTKLIDLKYG